MVYPRFVEELELLASKLCFAYMYWLMRAWYAGWLLPPIDAKRSGFPLRVVSVKRVSSRYKSVYTPLSSLGT